MHVGLDAVNLITSGDVEQYSFIAPAQEWYHREETFMWGPCQVAPEMACVPAHGGAHKPLRPPPYA